MEKNSVQDEKPTDNKQFVETLDSYITVYSKVFKIKKLKKIVFVLLIIICIIFVSYVLGDQYNVINLGISNDPPILSISTNSLSGYQPFEIELSIQTYDVDGAISSFHLDFGDGESYDGKSSFLIHSYTMGTYTITATVTDDKGMSTNKELIINVYNRNPVVNINSDITQGKAPLTVNFYSDITDSDGNITSYYWDFNDGTTSEESSPIHIFKSSGTYTVTLTAFDNDGGKAIDSIIIKALGNAPPVAIASSSKITGVAPTRIVFNGLESYDTDGKIVDYAWDFDDTWKVKGPSFGETPHLFEFPGEYNVVLTVTDDEGATDSTEITIIIT